jgi:hypothetical protein
MMILQKLLGHVPMTYNGGGGKGSAPAAQPMINPTPPVEEASVEIEDDATKKKLDTSKKQLKIPLAETQNTGLKV